MHCYCLHWLDFKLLSGSVINLYLMLSRSLMFCSRCSLKIAVSVHATIQYVMSYDYQALDKCVNLCKKSKWWVYREWNTIEVVLLTLNYKCYCMLQWHIIKWICHVSIWRLKFFDRLLTVLYLLLVFAWHWYNLPNDFVYKRAESHTMKIYANNCYRASKGWFVQIFNNM